MTTDLDIYRSAKLLIDQHGESAALEAAFKSDAMLDRGDLDGAAIWRRIVAAALSHRPDVSTFKRCSLSRPWPPSLYDRSASCGPPLFPL